MIPSNASKVYGEADPTLAGTLIGFLTADNVNATYSREAGETVDGSPYEISATLSPEDVLGNYEITYNTAEFSITKKDITVTADPTTMVYGSHDPALTYTYEGLLEGDQISGTLARIPGSNVGEYQITIGNLTAGPNYKINFVANDLTITPRPIEITAEDKEKVIGDPDPTLTFIITSGSLAYDDEIVGSLARDLGEELGTYPIRRGTLFIDDNNAGENYDLNFVEGTFTIKPIPLIITAHATSKVYGDDDPEITYTASDPTVTLTGALEREPGEYAGTYAIMIGTLSAGDQYAITLVPADFVITKRPITITADYQEKIEGDPDPELTWRVTSGSLVDPDTIIGELMREPGEEVGLYRILIGSLGIEDGNNGENYDLRFEEGTFNILTGIVNIYLPLIRR